MDGTDESRWLVVDGLQRLSALSEFVIDESLKLRGLEFLSDYENYRFGALPRKLQRRILETQVTVFLIQENTPSDVKFNIFKRINTGGLPLSTQEIRHALHQGPATELLRQLAEDPTFIKATKGGIPDKRMGDRECILRFIAFSLSSPFAYRAFDLDAFLNETMATLNRLPISALEDVARQFHRSMALSEEIFGGNAFRKVRAENARRGPINRALFEIWSVTLGRLAEDAANTLIARKDILNRYMAEALDDVVFDASVTFGTGDRRKVLYRFEKAEHMVSRTLL